MMKGQKGITLVALIITIIVMLILVGVSISVAMNGGLFQKAADAKDETIQAQLDEAATLAKAEVLAAYYDDGTAIPDELVDEIQAYLDDEKIDVTEAAHTAGIYSVKATAGDKEITTTIDLSSIYEAPQGE